MNMLSKVLCTAFATLSASGAAMAAGDVVFSQVYGAGGNSGATYNADYAELFNRSAVPQDISNYSIQYFSASNGAGGRVNIPAGTIIQPGAYYLVKLSTASTTVGLPLPAPDLDSTLINAAASNGRLVLVNNTTALASGTCHVGAAGVVDLVGFGTASCFEGTAGAPAPSSTLAIYRASGGCTDTDNNQADFSVLAPNPRNSASATNICGSGTPPTGSGSSSPASGCSGAVAVTFTVTTTIGTPNSPISTVTGDFSSIGLSQFESFVESPANTWTLVANVPTLAVNTYNFPVTITDGLGRIGNAVVSYQVIDCNPQITSGTGASPSGVCNGSNTTLTVNVTPGQNPTSASYTVNVDLSLLGGSATNAMTQTGPTSFQLVVAVPGAATPGLKALPITVTDDQNRTDTGTISIYNDNCTPANSDVVISQVYGGGGNSGATLTNDFVELFNRGSVPVDITGWSVQYASASDTNGGFASGNPATNVPVVLSGVIQPGQYYLVQMAAGAGGTQALPTPDATGAVAMGSSEGRIALVRNSTSLGALGATCTSTDIADLIGYGTSTTTGAICFEGVVAAPTLSNTNAAFRQQNGCQDNNYNRVDFFTAAPAPRNSASPFNACGVVTPTGACCVSGVCSITTQTACTGTYQGNATVCTPNPCPVPTGACCNGSSCTIQTSAFCGTVGGTYQGDGSACTPNPCAPSTGVCCRGATCSLTTATACIASGTAGATFVGGPTCNSGSATTPCCYADYNKAGGISVQDIFDFLNDWFAGSTYANTGGNGTGSPQVQSIFDFLNAWFAGGC